MNEREMVNRHILDTLNKKEEEQYSHLIEREKARKIVQKYLRNETYDEFLDRKENENADNR